MPANKDPAVLFYTSDFLTGTMRYTDEEVGQYIRALCSQHQSGHFDRSDLLRFFKSYDNRMISKFEQDADGKYFNRRMEEEIIKRENFCKSKSHPGLSGRPIKNKNNHMNTGRIPVENHSENENEIEIRNEIGGDKIDPINEDRSNQQSCFPFEEFWTLYAKKVDSKKCALKYAKLAERARKLIKDCLPGYVEATPDVKFRKNPLTWLNGECWNDLPEAAKPPEYVPGTFKCRGA